MNNTSFKKPTLLDYAILGLIQNQPRSGYNIRKVFETTALGVYSSSPGTIYPALKRLQKNGLVKKITRKDTNKNEVQITQKGIQALKNWLLKPIEKRDVERSRDELLLRFAFMEELLTAHQKITFLESFHDLLKIYIKELKAYHDREAGNLPIHGRLSFEHGIATYQTTLRWCKTALLFFKKESLT